MSDKCKEFLFAVAFLIYRLPLFSYLRLPHIRPAGSYLRFSPLPAFRTYHLLIPTCSFSLFPFSACTDRRFLHASPLPPRFPHVQSADPYMRFQPFPIFRTYNPPIPTCSFSLFPFSACTTRSPHIGIALPVRDTQAKALLGCNCLNM